MSRWLSPGAFPYTVESRHPGSVRSLEGPIGLEEKGANASNDLPR